jgi:hypothetical protein
MGDTLLMSLSVVFSGVVSLVLEIAMLVVALGPVHKHRPDASMLLAGCAGINLLATLFWYPASFLLPRVLGVAGYAGAHTVLSLLTTLLHAASGVLLIVALIRLAVPANPDPTGYE